MAVCRVACALKRISQGGYLPPPTHSRGAVGDPIPAAVRRAPCACFSLLQCTPPPPQVRSAASFLAVLAGDCRAASCLLACHSLKLQEQGAALLKYYSSGT